MYKIVWQQYKGDRNHSYLALNKKEALAHITKLFTVHDSLNKISITPHTN